MNGSAGPGEQVRALVGLHLALERRTGEALLVVAPFGAVALLLLPMAVGTDIPLLRQVGPGFYWLVVLLFGVMLTVRHTAEDGPGAQALLAQCGVDPVARAVARVVADAVLLLAFQLVLAPVAVALYDPRIPGWPWLFAVLPLVAIGLAALGALAGAVSSGAPGRALLGPLLVLPLAVPLLLGATQVIEAARYARAPWPWLLLMGLAELLALLATLLTAPSLEETE
ncbi:heme transporter [Actinotalea ferrariae CF5-4]|uniref:Heme transporter n=1 Tax=Actinotalea ferrariae CF5-4 TaxID=948458 RepID=A0A021VZJ8_9CELL|nr:heme exporter protein CcmB [Actinotalea ferrariae]EYR64492.1 heme transporter [Actinotalea ferrariae CF5-4]